MLKTANNSLMYCLISVFFMSFQTHFHLQAICKPRRLTAYITSLAFNGTVRRRDSEHSPYQQQP